MTLVGSKILHYRIIQEIGAGGMGIVYLAEDEKLHRKVALKFVGKAIQDDAAARERLVREARAASRLNHPNIVAMHAIEETPDHIFIVMEYVEGESIRDLVKRGEMDWERALHLAPQILSALATAHENDIVHRDVKSDNIMLTPRGQLKVLDFGLARGREGAVHVSRAGSSAGTPAYMSPEQVQDGEVDQRSDLFSFGVVLYEMVTGRLPFKGAHDAAVTYSSVNEAPTAVHVHNKQAPQALQDVIGKLLQKNPRDRYQNAAEVMEDLRKVRAGGRVSAHRRIPLPAAFAMGVALLAALGVLYVKQRPHGDGLVSDASAGRKMMVVLPFENLGPTDQEYFADGVTEEITTHLAQLSGLGVISRTSAMKYKGSSRSLREIGKELGVDYALEGSVRWDKSSGTNTVRISAQLIRINDDTHLWADNFDGVYDQIFDLQSEIAGKVANALDVTLLAPERAAIAAAPTENLDAYDLYMRGRARYERAIGKEDFLEAERLVEQAVALDSTFADAQAFLARRYANDYFNNMVPEQPRLEQARRAALAATRHADNGPAGHIAMGYYHYYGSRDYQGALREFDIAQQMQPNNAEVLEAIAFVQRRQGRWQESVDNLERAIVLDPNDADRIGNLLQTLMYTRRWDDTERYIKRGLALDPNNLTFTGYQAFLLVVRDGNVDGARKLLTPYIGKHYFVNNIVVEFDMMARDFAAVDEHIPNLRFAPGVDTAGYYLQRASAYHFSGDQGRARVYADSAVTYMTAAGFAESESATRLGSYATGLAMVDRNAEAVRAIDRASQIMPVERDAMSGTDVLQDRAIIRIILKDYDGAIRDLQYLLSVPSSMSPAILRLHPGFDPLRGDPRFQQLVQDKISS